MKKSNLTEQQLLCLLKAKDRKAFDVLYDRYARTLYNVIFKIVRCRELADDVLQDSFIKIWLHISAYDSYKGSLFTFILNISRNTAIDKIRSLSYRNRSSFCSLDLSITDKEFSVRQQTDFIGVDTYISRLAPPHQILVDLVYMQGYTQEQAAKVLHIPLGTVKSRLKVAITQLKETLT